MCYKTRKFERESAIIETIIIDSLQTWEQIKLQYPALNNVQTMPDYVFVMKDGNVKYI